MKKTFGILFLFTLFAPVVFAYEVFVTEVKEPYDLQILEVSIETEQIHLGVLDDYPIMYEFELKSPATLRTKMQQNFTNSTPIPFGLMLVKKDVQRGGVVEILRYNPTSEDWTRSKNRSLGLTLLETNEVSQELESGVYRLEVSTPENIGNYSLAIGTESADIGYFDKVKGTREVQKHFGYSIFKMLTSSLIYYPLGIIFLLLLIHKTWKYRKVIKNVS